MQSHLRPGNSQALRARHSRGRACLQPALLGNVMVLLIAPDLSATSSFEALPLAESRPTQPHCSWVARLRLRR